MWPQFPERTLAMLVCMLACKESKQRHAMAAPNLWIGITGVEEVS